MGLERRQQPKMPLLRTIASRAAPALRGHTVCQRANVFTRPAKEKIGPLETAIGLGGFSLAILGPSGWILAHLEDYKKKESSGHFSSLKPGASSLPSPVTTWDHHLLHYMTLRSTAEEDMEQVLPSLFYL